jgi:guanylate kinase
MSGKLIILSAPSGAGKSTIIERLLKKDFNLEFSISACTRKPRGNEKHGVEYYFLSPEDFKSKILKNEFIEWEEVYEDHYYGTLKSEIDRIFAKGNNVIFDIDIAGGLNIKKQYGNKALSIFIMPPSVEELENRLRKRGTDSEEDIIKRIEKARFEISFSDKFDVVIVNDDIDEAVTKTEKVLFNFLGN